MTVTRQPMHSRFTAVALATAGSASIAVGFGFARYGFGLFVPAFRTEFGLDTATIGAIGSGTYVVYLVSLLGAGAASAYWGPRLPVVVGNGSASFGLTLVAFAPSADVFVVGILIAAASSGWAPFADAVALRIRSALRGRILAVIGTGTTFGLLVAGSLALFCANRPESWRVVWAVFAVVAGIVTVWSALVVPASPLRTSPNRPRRRFRPGAAAMPLFGHSLLFGTVGSGYYTFAVDLVREEGLAAQWSALLWLLVGLGGLSGVASGEAARRMGLGRALGGCVLMLATSIALLAALPSNPSVAAVAALSFGFGYMPIAALLALWNQELHPDNPISGLTLVLSCIGLGSIIGPFALSVIAESRGLRVAFFLIAGLMVLGLWLRPASPAEPEPTRRGHRLR